MTSRTSLLSLLSLLLVMVLSISNTASASPVNERARVTQAVSVDNQSSCDVRVVVMQGTERVKTIAVTSLSKRRATVALQRTGVPTRYVVEPGAGCTFDRYTIDAELVDAATVDVTVGGSALTSTARPGVER